MKRSLCIVAVILLTTASALATTYDIPPDYEVTCLELATGKVVWRRQPGPLPRPQIKIVGNVVIAEPDPWLNPGNKQLRYLLDASSGKVLSGILKRGKRPVIEPLPGLPRGLKSADGRVFEYRSGYTRHLIAVRGGKKTIVKRLDDFPHELHVVGDLAIFTFAGGTSFHDSGGGEVYAWDLKQRRLAWEFSAASKLTSLAEHARTDISVDGHRVLLSVDQTVFGLAIDTGQLQWVTKLPRQQIRSWDTAYTGIGKVGDMLLVQCYEDLFALSAADGRLRWSFDAGPFGAPWPTAKGGQLYLAARGNNPVAVLSTTSKVQFKTRASALRIKTDQKAPGGYRIEYLSIRRVPAGADVYWSLRPPPPTKGKKRLLLELVDDLDGPEVVTKLDVTVPLTKNGEVYLKSHAFYDEASLFEGKSKIVSSKRPWL